MKQLRLLPLVTVAAGGLLFLKTVGLVSGDAVQPGPRIVRAQDTTIPGPDAALTTGSVSTPAPAPAGAAPAPQPAPTPPRQNLALPQPPQVSASERAILERLQERRQELDGRQREMDMRENLLRAAERRMEQRANELKELEGRIAGLEQRRDEAEQQRFRGVVSMYETMRAKDAARIFDSLELSVLVEVARAMKPPKLADVMAQMQAAPAQRLTIELARRPGQTAAADPRTMAPSELPKIEGRPSR
jgi:flagellar motility protein MotE (MotC chaperone)